MDTKKILEQYDKYLEIIKECNKTEFTKNYEKFLDFIRKKLVDESDEAELWTLLRVNAASETIDAMFDRGFGFKELSSNWKGKDVMEFYQALEKIKEKEEEFYCKTHYNSKVPESLAVMLGRLQKIIDTEQDMGLKLYMWHQYRKHEREKASIAKPNADKGGNIFEKLKKQLEDFREELDELKEIE